MNKINLTNWIFDKAKVVEKNRRRISRCNGRKSEERNNKKRRVKVQDSFLWCWRTKRGK